MNMKKCMKSMKKSIAVAIKSGLRHRDIAAGHLAMFMVPCFLFPLICRPCNHIIPVYGNGTREQDFCILGGVGCEY